jgi:tripartite-type tricarboxylate transporter receptor subunit TctC
MKKNMILISMAALFVLIAFSTGQAAPFYEGKIMKVIVPTKPGGGYDLYGRLVANYMQKHLPGSTIIVKNAPGAGHIIGTNEIFSAKPDGLTFGTFNRALTLSQIAGLKGIKFDLSKMSWLGSAASSVYSLVMNTKFKSLDDVRKAPVVRLSSAGLGTQSHITTALFSLVMGYDNIRIATGYLGGEAEMAMIRGELEGQFGDWASMMPFVRDGNAAVVLFIGKKQPAGYEQVPLLRSLVADAKHKPTIDLLDASLVLSRPFAGPPGIPEDRLKLLRDAFAKALADPELLSVAKKAEISIDYINAAEATQFIKNMLQISPELRKIVKEAYGSN